MNESQSNSFLAEQPVGALMRKFSLPCILSLLVGALYNIVDQLFIANASYLGSYGNAANSVVFPLTVIALAIATMIGDGCCAYVSIRLGAGEQEQAHRSVGNAIVLTLIVSVVLTAVYLIFMNPILRRSARRSTPRRSPSRANTASGSRSASRFTCSGRR